LIPEITVLSGRPAFVNNKPFFRLLLNMVRDENARPIADGRPGRPRSFIEPDPGKIIAPTGAEDVPSFHTDSGNGAIFEIPVAWHPDLSRAFGPRVPAVQ